jgi:hypothetical protein
MSCVDGELATWDYIEGGVRCGVGDKAGARVAGESIMDQQAQIVRVNKIEKFLYDPKPQLIVTWVKQCEKLLLLTLFFC